MPSRSAALRFMREALREARAALSRDEVPVGAVVVQNGTIVGRGGNEIIHRRDPSAHAELLAIRRAAAKLRTERLSDCVIYTTLEPCPMCAGGIVLARIREVVYGARDPKSGAAGSVMNVLANQSLNHRCQIRRGPLAATCGRILRKFFKGKRRKTG